METAPPVAPGPLPRTTCPDCGRDVPVRREGELRQHKAASSDEGWCVGSGTFPVPRPLVSDLVEESTTQAPSGSNNAVTDTAETGQPPTPDPFAWVDQAWSEASARETGDRYNVWTARGRKGRCIGRWPTLKGAIAAAFEHRPARVFDGFVELKTYRTSNPVALCRLIAVCGQLSAVTDETPLAHLCERAGLRKPITAKRAEELIVAVAAGKIEWKGHTVQLTPNLLELVGNKPNLVVRPVTS